jgi:hypothetical protein
MQLCGRMDARSAERAQRVAAIERGEDPFTMEAKLCDDDGIVRGGSMHHGTDYPCTGSAHYAGEHIRCIGPAHPGGLPGDLLRLLRDSGGE